MNFSVKYNVNHYEVYIDNRFYCSADNMSEVTREICEYENQAKRDYEEAWSKACM